MISKDLDLPARVKTLKEKMQEKPRHMSIEQAMIITDIYRKNPDDTKQMLRAKSLAAALDNLKIGIDTGELIVGNRTIGACGGVVFPEAGVSWVEKELDTLPTRPQDRFDVNEEDAKTFREEIAPFWKGKSLEDKIRAQCGDLVDEIALVVKMNQKDHAQGHICPDTEGWLKKGPVGLCAKVKAKLKKDKDKEKIAFYQSLIIVLEAASRFMMRYAVLADEMATQKTKPGSDDHAELLEIARICRKLSLEPAETFHEAIQSVWFLHVILHMESNASSFSPGRMDQYLYPYYRRDVDTGIIDDAKALELIECLWLKFNQIVYMRNSHSAKFFAGFPIGFNVAIGGQTREGKDASNELSYLFLKAQEQLHLPQPNLSARIFEFSDDEFIKECSRVIGKGSGMPQIFNDKSIIPALENRGISGNDAIHYAIVGCVELTTHGNNLGWSDAAMFNMVKALELAINNGKCLISDRSLGPDLGNLIDFGTYEELENALKGQVEYFIGKMLDACEVIEKVHQDLLPSPFLSCVINDCIKTGIDVTAGGAKYNLSGIQVIQPANIADSLASVKELVYEKKLLNACDLLDAIRVDYENYEPMRKTLLKSPKYGNDIDYVDSIAAKWIDFFSSRLKGKVNYRGGIYHTGLYTVSAHIPMGQNVGATMDGRKSGEPLADGGMSAMYGRDTNGPTALLHSVSKIDSLNGSNGTLLNMKFLPSFFADEAGIEKFSALLRAFVELKINHVQFNVVNKEDLLAAQREPEKHQNLIIRVAGYSAYFTQLAFDLQNEIIARTTHGD